MKKIIIICVLVLMLLNVFGCNKDPENDICFIQVSAGDSHAVALDENGVVYTWGYNASGQLGLGKTSGKEHLNKIKLNVKINQVVAGDYFTIVLDENNNLWQTGKSEVCNEYSFTMLNIETKFKYVSAGDAHVLAIDEKGNIWAWGDNKNGQLGVGLKEKDYTFVPRKVEADINFSIVEAGQQYSLAIDNDGNIWAWGINEDGQLGNGEKGDSQYINPICKKNPVQITNGTRFIKLAAGKTHSLALDIEGNVWAWGNNFDGQLGDGTNQYSLTPKKVFCDKNITNITAGDYHSIILDKFGKSYACGFNEYGRLGLGNIESQNTFVEIHGIELEYVNAGATFSMGIDKQKNIVSWGYNQYWQLGTDTLGYEKTPIMPFE